MWPTPSGERPVWRRSSVDARPIIATVFIDLGGSGPRQAYDYLVPPELVDKVRPGVLVVVPVRESEKVGFVVELGETRESRQNLKPIHTLVEGERLISANQIELARWLADHYLTGTGEALRLFLPPGAKTKLISHVELEGTEGTAAGKEVQWIKERGGRALTTSFVSAFGRGALVKLINEGKVRRRFSTQTPGARPKFIELALIGPKGRETLVKGARQRAILSVLTDRQRLEVKELLEASGASRASLNMLVSKGLVEIVKRRRERRTDTAFLRPGATELLLTPSQELAVNRVIAAIKLGVAENFLLHGVTGSGKTEVYLRAVKECLLLGRKAIILAPEIAILPQLAERVANAFGDAVAVIHSGLPPGERYDAWCAVASGEKTVVVGARSALFAPVDNVGLIILDEEHDGSYKQQSGVRYDARTVAERLAKIHQAVLVKGSATPSLEALYQGQGGRGYIELPERVAGRDLPDVRLIDMRDEMKAGNYGIYSQILIDALKATLDNGNKAILLQNRRGFANFLLCRTCGHVPVCRRCSVSLTYHRAGNRMRCHYCDQDVPAPDACPNCQSRDWKYSGAGTQRVEGDLLELLPDAQIVRMDADTTASKGAHQRQLLRFYQAERAILIGTQMVAKGLDFPAVSLVGIVNADTALNLPDFRAAERTAQLLIQVSGRSGRGPVPGIVYVQTYNPENYAIQAALGKYDDFYRRELSNRQELDYPPFSSIINVIFSSRDDRKAANRAAGFAKVISQALLHDGQVLGPAPAPISKIKGYCRWHVLVSSNNPQRVKFEISRQDRLVRTDNDTRVIVDIDPVWML